MPRCVSFRSKSGTMELASAPSNTHTMKLMSKYKKAHNSDGEWPAFRKSRTFMIEVPQQLFGEW